MTLPVSIAQKLQQLLQLETGLPASTLKHAAVEKMLQDGVLQKRIIGKSKALVFIPNAEALLSYLHNHFGIADIENYIAAYSKEALSRGEAVTVSGNSKLKSIRTFKGFLVNCYLPVKATMNSAPFVIQPLPGSFTFISHYESFVPDPTLTIVGIENPENFSEVTRQRYLFDDIQPLFISRYPQSNDAIKWLQSIPNNYLHFGDLDFSGINIYLREYKKWLGEKARFFVPKNTADLLPLYGNRELYNRQLSLATIANLVEEESIKGLLALLHQHKKVLEQEIFIR